MAASIGIDLWCMDINVKVQSRISVKQIPVNTNKTIYTRVSTYTYDIRFDLFIYIYVGYFISKSLLLQVTTTILKPVKKN